MPDIKGDVENTGEKMKREAQKQETE